MSNTTRTALPPPSVTRHTIRVYLALKDSTHRSLLEDKLVLDGFDVRVFASAAALWEAFQERPARMVITERRFGGGMSGLELTRAIRKDFLLPYVFVVVMSTMSRIAEIKDGLAAGVDDYLVSPPHPLQFRSRVLVGVRWLQYLDSLHAGG